MTVHLFGAVSSPSCANFPMRRNAEDHKHEFSPDVANTILRNFYVDDCLKSSSSSSAAVKHVADLRKLMLIGGFNLTKWVSNDRHVLESNPPEERAKDVKELDVECDMLPTERALGASWFVETDAFGFKVNIKEKPCTRRGILSLVQSTIRSAWQLLSFSQQNFFFRTYAGKALAEMMRFRVYTYLDGRRGLRICPSFVCSQ